MGINPPTLIVFGGLPGVGKTTLAKALAAKISACYLRIDTIEQTLKSKNCLVQGDEGYLLAYAIAEENLRLGNNVISDSVNPIPLTRLAWQDIAAKAGASIFQIEIICSDTAEHKHRIETRTSDIDGHILPDWTSVMTREYHPWDARDVVIDTGRQTVEACIDTILKNLDRGR